jgi:peroxiredoxin
MRIVGALLLLTGLAAAFAQDSRPKPAPAFNLKNLDGLEVSSTNFAGQTLLVFFWMSADKPSQRQLPALVELQRDLGAAGVAVLGLVFDQPGNAAALKAFTTTNSVNFPILFANYEVVQGFGGLQAIPTIFVVEPHGMIVGRYEGVTEKETLRKLVQAILDTPR